MAHRRIIGYVTHIPRGQARTTGKQEGTQPKRLKRKRKRMNVQQQMRAWQDTLDGGSIVDVRKAAVEILAQLRHTVNNPAPAADLHQDITAKHYQEVCATVDALTGTLEMCDNAKRKTIAVSTLREILGGTAA